MQKAGLKRAKCSGMMVEFKEKTIVNAEQVELPILHLFTAVSVRAHRKHQSGPSDGGGSRLQSSLCVCGLVSRPVVSETKTLPPPHWRRPPGSTLRRTIK